MQGDSVSAAHSKIASAATLNARSKRLERARAQAKARTTRAIAMMATVLGAAFASTGAQADCFDEAARYQKVNPLVLRAIAWQESHNTPDALHKNENGSTDYGLMQINSIHLPKLAQYGISSETLMEPCKNVYIAAWHLRQKMNKYGNTWEAVGAYHSETPSLRDRYARQIVDILRRWKLLQAQR